VLGKYNNNKSWLSLKKGFQFLSEKEGRFNVLQIVRKAIPELRSGVAESSRPRSLFVGVLH
jgi:hypothetical protein